MFDEWDDLFDFRLGPFRMGASMGGVRPYKVAYARTEDTHILKLRLDPDLKKEDVKVRLQAEGILEIEWPRKKEGEEIPVG